MRKKRSIKKGPNKKFIFSSSVLFYLIVFSFVILLLFFYIQFDLGEKFFGPSDDVSFNIPDNCGVILGNLLHEIKNEDDCNIRCHNECGLRSLNYNSINFSQGGESCHSCECFCE